MNKSRVQELSDAVKVRPLHPDDDRAVYELLHASQIIGEIPFIPGTEYSLFSEWLAMRDPHAHRYVAEGSRGIIGFLILNHKARLRLNHSGSLAMAVHSQSQSKNISRTLLSTALDLADNWLNLSRVELELPSKAEININNLKSLGFAAEGTRVKAAFQDGIWIDQRVMARVRVPSEWLEIRVNKSGAEVRRVPNKTPRQVEEIVIRPAEIGDADAYYEMLQDPALCRMTLQLPSQEIWQIESRLKDSKPWLHRFTAVADGKIVGSIAFVQNQTPGRSHIGSIGMKVHRDFWGIGIGTSLVKSVTELADNWLNIIRIELDVNTDNPAGIRLYEKSGFVVEGKKRFHTYGDGRWADSFFMARILEK